MNIEVKYYRPLHSNRRIIARPLIFVRRIIRRLLRFLIEPLVQEQNEINAYIFYSVKSTREALQNFMDDTVNTLQDLNNEVQLQKTQLAELKSEIHLDIDKNQQKMDEFQQKIEGFNLKNEAELNEVRQSVENGKSTSDEMLAKEKSNLQAELNEVRQSVENGKSTSDKILAKEKSNLQAAINELYAHIDKSEMQVVRALKNIAKKPDKDDAGAAAMTKFVDYADTYESLDYFDFENKFRGIRRNVKIVQAIHLPFFEGKSKVIDLGCGRGEFLELLRDNDINAVGVDLHEDFALYCQMKGLDVVCGDAIEYLLGADETSADGIFASHLAEHLDTNQLISLCKRAYEVLRPEGCLIMETPNPTCLATYCNWFYVDPTHIKPVHPLTLEYYLKQAGFKNIQVIYTEHSRTGYQLSPLCGEQIHNLDQFNDGINRLSNLLFGSMDYVIIAKK